MHTIIDLVPVDDQVCVFGAPNAADDGAAECLSTTGGTLVRAAAARSLRDSLHFTDAAQVRDRLYTTYGRVLTSDLVADDTAAKALSAAITGHLGRDDWMLSSGLEAAGDTLLMPVDVGGSYSPRQPQFQALLGVDVSNPTQPKVVPAPLTLAQSTIASLRVDGDRLFTLERAGGCALHVYSLANGLAPRGSVVLPTDGMCDGGLHFSPSEGQRIAVTGQAVLIGYDPEAVYVVDVSNLDKPVITGGVDIRKALSEGD